MSTRNGTDDERTDDCTTTTSFSDHGLGDGRRLIRETYYRLVDGGTAEFAPTERFFDRLETAFVWSYIGATDDSGVPPHVGTAIEDARARTREAFAADPDADLRTEVIPAFYQRVAGFHCVYRN
ncbi:hypothetical protein [Natronomonas marina]|uniref:hypothetical protein n=1 Tax=Natronomonas marina TaxID=2961939 RepID=UPI0020CA2533|nr:hypothetical protein [Natronomonas marina]